MNKDRHCVYVIPEDGRNRQIADGFILHHNVDDRRIQVMPEAGGWLPVLETFQAEYIQKLKNYLQAHVVMLIDFDGCSDQRRAKFDETIPPELKRRVFVVGSQQNSEKLKQAMKLGFEEIGKSLADDCDAGNAELWAHEQLKHNDDERLRLVQTVKPFLFRTP